MVNAEEGGGKVRVKVVRTCWRTILLEILRERLTVKYGMRDRRCQSISMFVDGRGCSNRPSGAAWAPGLMERLRAKVQQC